MRGRDRKVEGRNNPSLLIPAERRDTEHKEDVRERCAGTHIVGDGIVAERAEQPQALRIRAEGESLTPVPGDNRLQAIPEANGAKAIRRTGIRLAHQDDVAQTGDSLG